jgi:hypothetical protein
MPSQKTMCPHCEGPATIRSSQQLSTLVREAKGVCNNPDCGHTFKMIIEVVCSLSPPAIPNPNINLPMSPHVRKAKNLQQTA